MRPLTGDHAAQKPMALDRETNKIFIIQNSVRFI